jgi:hypothetical protein
VALVVIGSAGSCRVCRVRIGRRVAGWPALVPVPVPWWTPGRPRRRFSRAACGPGEDWQRRQSPGVPGQDREALGPAGLSLVPVPDGRAVVDASKARIAVSVGASSPRPGRRQERQRRRISRAARGHGVGCVIR